MIDLHAHTRASDGQYPAAELVQRAKDAGLEVLGVTDHDTIAGLSDALETGRKLGIEVIPGIELSAYVAGHEAHLLGHFIDPEHEGLRSFARMLQDFREKRTVRMLERLEQIGVHASLEEVVAASGGKNLGRPHIAQVLIAHEYVKDLKEAFDRYIGVGRPGYVERYKLTSREAITLVGEAGGCVTLAHAFASHLGLPEIKQLKEEGIAGLEVAHPDHSAADRARAAALAAELDLVPTAGSDFHGPKIMPARTLGMESMGRRELERLAARASRNRRGK
jgi:predicted metal-dependent phosphoesterase TrpH